MAFETGNFLSFTLFYFKFGIRKVYYNVVYSLKIGGLATSISKDNNNILFPLAITVIYCCYIFERQEHKVEENILTAKFMKPVIEN